MVVTKHVELAVVQRALAHLAEVDERRFGTVEVDGDDWEFEVDADDGIVTLEGDVEDFTDRSDAIRSA